MSDTSFFKKPLAGDDYYGYTEDDLALLASGLLVTIDVMANDLGGKAKTLFSIDDGDGNALDPSALLNADGLVDGISAWENTSLGNLVRINNGKLELDLTNSVAALGGTDIHSLAAGDVISDSFVYAIRLANGTLSWAHVTFEVFGENDAATITGDTAGAIGEDDVTAVTGTLTVSDPDHDESHAQAVVGGATANGFGTYSVDADGNWSYTLDNAAVQYLDGGEWLSDSFEVTSLDGSATQTVTVTINGANDRPRFTAANAARVTESNSNPVTGSASLLFADPDASDRPTVTTQFLNAGWSLGPNTLSAAQIAALSVALTLTPDPGNTNNGTASFTWSVDPSAIDFIAAGEQVSVNYQATVTDDDGAFDTTIAAVYITGTNDLAAIAGDTAGAIGEDDVRPVTGTLTVSDPDHDQSHAQAVVGGATANGLGTYSVDADGNWSYILDNARVQHLGTSETLSDRFTVTSLDGTATETVTINIIGEDEAPVCEAEFASDIVIGTLGGAYIVQVNPDGTMTNTGPFLGNGGQFGYDAEFADVNNDGADDVIIAGDNGLGRLYYNNGSGGFVDSGFYFPGTFQSRVAAGDIDNDGDLDLYFQGGTGPTKVYRNDGVSGFTVVFSTDEVGTSGFYRTAGDGIFADFNGDGYNDLYINRYDENIYKMDSIYFNDGTGHFYNSGIALPTEAPNTSIPPAIGDVNGDGAIDIVATLAGGTVHVLINDGSGNFTDNAQALGYTGVAGGFLGDFDCNGTTDLVLGGGTNAVSWWSNDGTGQFSFGGLIAAGGGIRNVADFNDDDAADLLLSSGGSLHTYLNDGSGNLTLADSFAPVGFAFGSDTGVADPSLLV